MIPKIIHQTWKDKTLPPIIYSLISENIKLLKSNGYELMFWTDDMILKLISEEYPNFYNIYKMTRTGVQKGDIARILLVYHYGGIYIDLDVLILLEDYMQQQQDDNDIENEAYDMSYMNEDFYNGNTDGTGAPEEEYDDYEDFE